MEAEIMKLRTQCISGMHKNILAVAAALAVILVLSACANSTATDPTTHTDIRARQQGNTEPGETYNEKELASAISTHMGVTAESAASVVERLFRKQGRPVGYITGEEASAAIVGGLRYGKGTLWMKDGRQAKVYWQGPSVGFDWGANGSKVFTLVYGLDNPELLYQRIPGVDGSAFLVAGMAVNYQRTSHFTLAPIRTGVGARLGANVGYLRYSKKRKILPF